MSREAVEALIHSDIYHIPLVFSTAHLRHSHRTLIIFLRHPHTLRHSIIFPQCSPLYACDTVIIFLRYSHHIPQTPSYTSKLRHIPMVLSTEHRRHSHHISPTLSSYSSTPSYTRTLIHIPLVFSTVRLQHLSYSSDTLITFRCFILFLWYSWFAMTSSKI